MTTATLRGVADPRQGLQQLHARGESDFLSDTSFKGLDLLVERPEELELLLQAASGFGR
jgi:hypothetical protein